jgi:hypothetical protein
MSNYKQQADPDSRRTCLSIEDDVASATVNGFWKERHLGIRIQ